MFQSGTKIECNGMKFEIIKHIGKGKGGDSYLAKFNNKNVVFKKMHYEPCDTYTFENNKLQSELRDYRTLKRVGITIPELICYDDEQQFLVKEYIDGQTIAEIVGKNKLKDEYIVQILRCARFFMLKN